MSSVILLKLLTVGLAATLITIFVVGCKLRNSRGVTAQRDYRIGTLNAQVDRLTAGSYRLPSTEFHQLRVIDTPIGHIHLGQAITNTPGSTIINRIDVYFPVGYGYDPNIADTFNRLAAQSDARLRMSVNEGIADARITIRRGNFTTALEEATRILSQVIVHPRRVTAALE